MTQMFTKGTTTPLRLYNELQKLISEQPKGLRKIYRIIYRLNDGVIPLTMDDVPFLRCNHFRSDNPISKLVNSITLFTQKGVFFDNVPVFYSFSEDENNWAMYIMNEKLFVTLPLEEAQDFDVDSDIINYVIEPFALPASVEESIIVEFKMAAFDYYRSNKRQVVEDALSVMEIILQERNIKARLLTLIRQAFDLYVARKQRK